jgi:hypothetical protein
VERIKEEQRDSDRHQDDHGTAAQLQAQQSRRHEHGNPSGPRWA